MQRDIPWLRIFVEGIVIVGSILLAFGIDAWWEDLRERTDAQSALLGLQTDFGQFRAALTFTGVVTQREIDAAEYLLSLDGVPAQDIVVAKADSAMRRMINAQTFDPGRRTLDALTSSGQLELIRNPELRAILSTWSARVDEIRDDQLVIRDFVRTTLVPHMAREGAPLARIYHTFYPDRPPDRTSDAEARSIYARLASDSEFRSLLSYRHNWALGVKAEIEGGLDRVTQILTLIEAELGPADGG